MKLNASFPRRTRLYALLFSLVLCLTACSAPSDPSGTLSEFSRDGARTRLMISAVQQSESSVAVSLDVSPLPNA